MDRKLSFLNFDMEYLDEIEEIAKENPDITFADALEMLAKKYPQAVKQMGTLHQNGRFTKTKISEEGVETKESDLKKEIDDLLDKA